MKSPTFRRRRRNDSAEKLNFLPPAARDLGLILRRVLSFQTIFRRWWGGIPRRGLLPLASQYVLIYDHRQDEDREGNWA